MKTKQGLCQCGCGGKPPLAKRTRAVLGHIRGLPVHFIQGHNTGLKGRPATNRTPEYVAYANAKQRCTNANRKGYNLWGGRGIKFRFINFSQFFAELGPRTSPKHTVDRTNNDGHYEPGNVRWATRKQQIQNRRRNK